MFAWEEYSSELYVDREKELGDLLAWTDSASVSKQVKSLVAPPGAGKTWFLQAVQEKLEGRVKDAPPGRLVIFCDVPRLVDRNQSVATSLDSKAVFDWLAQEQAKAFRFCSDVRPIDRSVQIAQAIDQLVIDLCEKCALQHPVVVLVDGLDEAPPDQAAKIEWEILERFIGKQCVRMVIAHRDEYTLKNPLKNQAERFFLSIPPSVEEQFQKFKKWFYKDVTPPTETNLDQFKRLLTHYQWNHPYINAFLFDKALQRVASDVTQLLTTDDLRECLYAVIERRDKDGKPRFGALKGETFDCLKQIAKGLPNTWSLADLLRQLGLREQDECMKQLFEYGVAFYNPTIRRYQLADGLRELARDLVERGG